MGVTPTLYVNGDPMTASAIRGNHELFRAWLNVGILAGDLVAASVKTDAIQRGEYLSVVPDHRFVTGDHHSLFRPGGDGRNMIYGATIVPSPDVVYHVPISQTGRRFYIKKANSFALYTAFINVLIRTNSDKPNADDATGPSSDFYVYKDDVQQTQTRIRCFPPTAAVGDAEGNLTANHRYIAIHGVLKGLTAGWHEVDIRARLRHDGVAVRAINAALEVFEA